MLKTDRIKDMLMVAGILAVLVIFFYKFVFLGMVPLNADWLVENFSPWNRMALQTAHSAFNNDTDPVLYMYPIKYITIGIMKGGHLPLWNPYILCGAPLWGNNFACPLNPLNIVFFVFDFAKAWGIFLMLQFAMAGTFMYLFMRELKACRLGAGIAAIAYMLNVTFVIWFQTMSYVGVFSWIPLVFYMIERVFKTRSMIIAFWCGVSMALFAWSGLVQLAAYSAAFSLAYLFFRYTMSIAEDSSQVWRLGLLFLVVIAAAAIFSLPELIVQKTNIASSTRTAGRYGLSLLYPQMLVSYLSPYFYGMKFDGWDLGYGTYIFNRGLIRLSPPYIGILPIFMAAIGFFTRRSTERYFFLLFSVGILAALAAFGLPVVYRPILKYVPFFGSVDHYRLTTIYAFSMAVMAGWGITALASADARRARICRRIAYAVLALILIVFAKLTVFSYVDANSVGAVLASAQKSAPGALFDGSHSLKSVYKFFEYLVILKGESGCIVCAKEVYVPLVLALASLLIILRLLRPGRRAFWTWAAFIFVAADLLYYGLAFPAYSLKTNVFPKTPSAGFLLSDSSLYRVLGYSGRTRPPRGDAYPPNTGLVYGFQDIRGYENIGQSRWFYRFIMGDRPDEIVVERFNDYDGKFLPFLSVKYLMSDVGIRSGRWDLVYDKEIKIYKNNRWMPRALATGSLRIAQDGEAAWDAINDPSFDPSRQIVIEPGAMRLNGPPRAGVVEHPGIRSYGPNEVVIDAAGRCEGVLALSDAFFPGWRVYVDGRERQVLKADYAFRGVVVGKDDRTVRFVFRPAWLYESLYLCAAVFLIMMVLSVKRLIDRRAVA